VDKGEDNFSCQMVAFSVIKVGRLVITTSVHCFYCNIRPSHLKAEGSHSHIPFLLPFTGTETERSDCKKQFLLTYWGVFKIPCNDL